MYGMKERIRRRRWSLLLFPLIYLRIKFLTWRREIAFLSLPPNKTFCFLAPGLQGQIILPPPIFSLSPQDDDRHNRSFPFTVHRYRLIPSFFPLLLLICRSCCPRIFMNEVEMPFIWHSLRYFSIFCLFIMINCGAFMVVIYIHALITTPTHRYIMVIL